MELDIGYDTWISINASQYAPKERIPFPESIKIKSNRWVKDVSYKQIPKEHSDWIHFYDNRLLISEDIFDNETGSEKNILSIEWNRHIDKISLWVWWKFSLILNLTWKDITNEFEEVSESSSIFFKPDNYDPSHGIQEEEFTYQETNYALNSPEKRKWDLNNPKLFDFQDIREALYNAWEITKRLMKAVEFEKDIDQEVLMQIKDFKSRSSIAFAAWQDKNDPDKKES